MMVPSVSWSITPAVPGARLFNFVQLAAILAVGDTRRHRTRYQSSTLLELHDDIVLLIGPRAKWLRPTSRSSNCKSSTLPSQKKHLPGISILGFQFGQVYIRSLLFEP